MRRWDPSVLVRLVAILFPVVPLISPLARGQAPPPAAATAPEDRPPSARGDDEAAPHPLDPLTPDEIRLAVATIRKEKSLGEGVRFASVLLDEPAKGLLAEAARGKDIPRVALIVLLDRATGRGYEATVDLTARRVRRFEALPPGVQPPILMEEFSECEEAAKKSPAFREAMRKRGIDDVSLVMVDAWSAGHYGNEPEEDRGRRLVRALSWARTDVLDNGYAHPIEGVLTVIDLNRKEVVRVEDHGVVPVPKSAANWTRAAISSPRKDVRPLDVVQPDGPGFSVRGREVRWQKWSLRVGFSPREGLVLHSVSYDGRPILHRGSIAEMVVPYGDPKETAYRKNVFDIGEYGVGMLANSLELGCDCLGTIRYFDAHLADNQGRVTTIKNAICVHEEDHGLLWKHTDWRTAQSEVRRSRRLAVSLIANVGNYDYGFYWYFYQDGSIQHEVKLTGIVNTQGLRPGESSRFGTEVSPGVLAPNHQHFFHARLDLDVDGPANSVLEVNTKAAPAGPENPHGGAFFTEAIPLTKESEARRSTSPQEARFWRVVNPGRKNALGRAVGYRLMPGENAAPYAVPGSPLLRRAGFLAKSLWATPYRPGERYPAGDYPNQSPEDRGLALWTKADRGLVREDLVLWYTFGHTHVPRTEDWPVMPVASIGFWLRPDGFFDGNPALDVPASPSPSSTAHRASP
ncbi:Copper methylamine oxidase precursor [Aquisphaera giovannonii]|uniref:Amine oxidase n=1 Tax=Aquisphaera giovannonii TaxID=406548 RepID=A0A5B9VZM0_9BACT|nr:primary-amine oxidase [Aquisphaera giovannonii]QEH33802.1 Copper methylamine oxidase precursor [Aquisphaera giovannonii]